VQAQQCVQPTGPNRSMALPIPSPKAARGERRAEGQRTEIREQTLQDWLCSLLSSGPARCKPCPDASRSKGQRRQDARRIQPVCPLSSVLCPLNFELLAWPGGHSAGAPPDPIPNSAVKPRRAQGTAVLTVGERVVARPSQQFRPEVREQRSDRALPAPRLASQTPDARCQRISPSGLARGGAAR
jgi:hypothetical protein